MKCRKCGQELSDDSLFCNACGASVKDESTEDKTEQTVSDASAKDESAEVKTEQKNEEKDRSAFHNMIDSLGGITGEKGKVELHLSNLFSGVFKKHTVDERDELFIVGTKRTTPNAALISEELPKPWLYSRVFLMLALSFAVLWFMLDNFNNMNAYPGFVFLGALTIPISLLVLFWEINAPKNISFPTILLIFFVGGVLSLLVTLALFSILSPSAEMNYFDAIIIGFVEETAKVCLVFFFLRKNNSHYLLNGLLIGAAVGVGFAVFETAGYILRASLVPLVTEEGVPYIAIDLENALHLTFLRGVLSPGGHCVWAALEGVGIVCARKEGKNVLSALADKRFWILFLIPMTLHAVWDMPITFGAKYCFVQILLTVIAWVVLLTMIGAGFNQIKRLKAVTPTTDSDAQLS